MQMTSSRPYLVRAMYQWICDNGLTPYLLVDATVADCIVPVEHIQDGKIILNILPVAVNGLVLGDEAVTFSARFSGKSESIYIPIDAVLAVYARENGQGMMFTEEADNTSQDKDAQITTASTSDDDGPDDRGPGPGKPAGPKLHVVK